MAFDFTELQKVMDKIIRDRIQREAEDAQEEIYSPFLGAL